MYIRVAAKRCGRLFLNRRLLIRSTLVGSPKRICNCQPAKLFSHNFYYRTSHVGSMASADIKKYIEKLIADNDVVVFSKSYCPFCKKVKELFEKLKLKVCVVELDTVENGEEIQKGLLDKTGQKSVPSVFVKGEHVGGCDNTFEAHESGRLRELISY